MSKYATKASENIFYKARSEAAKYHDRLGSREGAAEELGMDRTRLANIELDNIKPYPEEVNMMADTYRAPELRNYFCTSLCPLGACIPKAELGDLDRVTLKTLGALKEIEKSRELLISITEDGIISESEGHDLKKILDTLDQVGQAATSLKIWVEKNLR